MLRWIVAIALLGSVAACADPKVSLATGTREFVASDY